MKLSMTLWCNEKKIRTLWELEWTIQVCVDMTPMKRHQERTDCFCLSEKDYKTKQSEIHHSTVDYTQVENKKTVENLHQSGHASKLTQRSNHKMLREIAKKKSKVLTDTITSSSCPTQWCRGADLDLFFSYRTCAPYM